MVLYKYMNNIYTKVIFGALLAVVAIMPSASSAYSYAYDPGYSNSGINILNNNTNTNTNVSPALSAEYIAQSNLTGSVYTYVQPTSSYRKAVYYPTWSRVSCGSCNSVVSIANVEVPKPLCTLVPAITPAGDVELQWTILDATIAYIDAGIGHIAPQSGSMIVNPKKSTVYNLTVLNNAGIASSCGAKVNVTIDNTTPTDPGNGDGNNGGDNGGGNDNNNNGGSSLFGDTFRAIALPIGVAFLILIVLLIVIMSKVKNAH